jgi:gliding motility-associated-like protein
LTVVPDLGITADFTITNPNCSYKSDGTFSIETVSNGTEPYSFIFDGNPFSINEEIKNLPGGEFEFSISDRYGCGFESTVTLVSPEEFVIELGPDIVVDLGDAIDLEPEANFPVEIYNWEPADLIDCVPPCDELIWAPPYSMFVSTTANSEKNCLAADSVFVTVNKARKAYFPNAFSPNNDGLNDYFTVFGAVPNVQYVERMAIFDRWGMLIFEKSHFIANEPTEGWDGTLNGNPVENGVYVYAIDICFLDEEIIRYTGNVTLIK